MTTAAMIAVVKFAMLKFSTFHATIQTNNPLIIKEKIPSVSTLIGNVIKEMIGLIIRWSKKRQSATIHIVCQLCVPVIEKPFKYFESKNMLAHNRR